MSKPRRQKTKSFKQSIRIICPGLTEREYLDALRAERYTGLTIIIEPKLGKADKYDEIFEDLRRDSSLNEPSPPSFFINDMDAIVAQSKLKQYLADKGKTIKASKGALAVIESMPCIEFWFLLHYIYTDKYFPSYESVRAAFPKELFTYEKTQKCCSKIYPILRDKMDKAMRNAARTMKRKASCEGDCSYTNMHELIEKLDLMYNER